MFTNFLVFLRKDLSEAKHETQSVLKFSDADVPPVEASGGQEQYYIRSAWHFQEMEMQLRRQLTVRCTPW